MARARAFVQAVPGAQLVETQGPGGATSIARQAHDENVNVLVPVGGDGTLQQVAAGLCLDEQGHSRTTSTHLLILPAGTGGDYRRSFSLTESVDHAVTRLSEPRPRQVDVGRLEYHDRGEAKVTAFINVLSFGLGGLTDRIVDTSPKWLGGKATYLVAALRATLVHQPTTVELWLDGQLIETAPFSNVAICLGQYFGGGMKIAPQADPSDGLFDVVTMELNKARTLGLSAHIYRGTHLSQNGVRHYRATQLRARAARPEASLVDADGEPMGSLPLQVDMLKGALTLLT